MIMMRLECLLCFCVFVFFVFFFVFVLACYATVGLVFLSVSHHSFVAIGLQNVVRCRYDWNC